MIATQGRQVEPNPRPARRSTARRPVITKVREEAEVNDSLPPDDPPGFGPPEPRERPAVVEVSAKFVRLLKARYRGRRSDPENLKVGRLAEVQAWLDSLEPGLVTPRRS